MRGGLPYSLSKNPNHESLIFMSLCRSMCFVHLVSLYNWFLDYLFCLKSFRTDSYANFSLFLASISQLLQILYADQWREWFLKNDPNWWGLCWAYLCFSCIPVSVSMRLEIITMFIIFFPTTLLRTLAFLCCWRSYSTNCNQATNRDGVAYLSK